MLHVAVHPDTASVKHRTEDQISALDILLYVLDMIYVTGRNTLHVLNIIKMVLTEMADKNIYFKK